MQDNERKALQDLIRSTAVRYANAGIAVIPVLGKAPVTKGWPDLRLAPDDIDAHFKPEHGIGVITGRASGLVVLDIDARNGGMVWFEANEHRLGRFIRERTGSNSGGLHLYFQYPAGLDTVPSLGGKKPFAPGVEVKADGGCQVVTYPSIHPDGGQYVIDDNLLLTDLAEHADPLPAWVLDECVARGRVAVSGPAVAIDPSLFTNLPEDIENAKRALIAHGPAIQGQNGDDHTFDAARIGRDFAISPDEWLKVLLKWNNKCVPRWTRRELQVKINSAYSKCADRIGCRKVIPPEEAFPDDLPPFAGYAEWNVVSITDGKPIQSSEPKESSGDSGQKKTKRDHTNPVFITRLLAAEWGAVACISDDVYVYENNRWRHIPEEIALARIHAFVLKKLPDANLQPHHTQNILKTLQNAYQRECTDFDVWSDGRHGEFVRVQNGILDLRNARLLPHSPDWFSLTMLPFSYDEDARAPTWEAFLESIWGNHPDQIEALQVWMGYMLSSDTRHQAFAWVIGPRRSGKGTILKVMQRIVGPENYFPTTINDLGEDFGLEEFIGKKFVFIPDAHSAAVELSDQAVERIKMITGEDTVRIRRKNRRALAIRFRAKLMMFMNEIPKLNDPDGAVMARVVLFRTIKTFAGREDLDLEYKLHQELPGIFNWAITGFEKYTQLRHLPRPNTTKDTFQEISDTLNPIQGFLRDYVEYVPLDDDERKKDPLAPIFLRVDEAYQLYRKWSAENGHQPKSKVKFTATINQQFSAFEGVKKYRADIGKRSERVFRTVFFNLRLSCTPESYDSSMGTKGATNEYIKSAKKAGAIPETASIPDDDEIF